MAPSRSVLANPYELRRVEPLGLPDRARTRSTAGRRTLALGVMAAGLGVAGAGAASASDNDFSGTDVVPGAYVGGSTGEPPRAQFEPDPVLGTVESPLPQFGSGQSAAGLLGAPVSLPDVPAPELPPTDPAVEEVSGSGLAPSASTRALLGSPSEEPASDGPVLHPSIAAGAEDRGSPVASGADATVSDGGLGLLARQTPQDALAGQQDPLGAPPPGTDEPTATGTPFRTLVDIAGTAPPTELVTTSRQRQENLPGGVTTPTEPTEVVAGREPGGVDPSGAVGSLPALEEPLPITSGRSGLSENHVRASEIRQGGYEVAGIPGQDVTDTSAHGGGAPGVRAEVTVAQTLPDHVGEWLGTPDNLLGQILLPKLSTLRPTVQGPENLTDDDRLTLDATMAALRANTVLEPTWWTEGDGTPSIVLRYNEAPVIRERELLGGLCTRWVNPTTCRTTNVWLPYPGMGLPPSQRKHLINHEFGHGLGLHHTTDPERIMMQEWREDLPQTFSPADLRAVNEKYEEQTPTPRPGPRPPS